MFGIVLFAHGSRDPAWAQPFARTAASAQARLPDALVTCAYLEHMRPSLEEAVLGLAARGATRIRVVPLFLGMGGHLRKDFPALMESIQAKLPGVAFERAPSLAEAPEVLDAIAGWVATSVGDPKAKRDS